MTSSSPDDIAICDIVKFELYFGAYNSSRVEENLETLRKFFGDFVSLPFEGEAAATCGRVRAQLKAVGTPIGSRFTNCGHSPQPQPDADYPQHSRI